jgi:hypothetical protein
MGMKVTKACMAAFLLLWLAPCCQNPLTPSIPLDDLLSAPLAIEINGRQFSLETFLYRDLMPGGEPGGSLLVAFVYLTAVDGQAFPDSVDSTRIWVVNGEEVWETTFQRESRPRNSHHINQLEKVTYNGPKWDIGARVEVVVRVTASLKAPCLLRATNQEIGAVY